MNEARLDFAFILRNVFTPRFFRRQNQPLGVYVIKLAEEIGVERPTGLVEHASKPTPGV